MTQTSEWYEKLKSKTAAECERTGSMLPFAPIGGRYKDLMIPGGIYWWCNGFWPGLLWQMYGATRDELYREAAQASGERLSPALEHPEKLDHDVGFLYLLSAVAAYRLTGSETGRQQGIAAAEILADRFHETGAYIQAWNSGAWEEGDKSGMMIADTMMNLSLLFWASEETGEERYGRIAKAHADTALQNILREDGSANHIAVLDPQTGEFLEAPAGQGYAPGSSWSRGQSWVLYGFTNAYRHTKEERYLAAAKHSAHYCISALSDRNWLPAVDFRAPEDDGRFDASAGAIIASGLLELADVVPEPEQGLYRNAARKILAAVEEKFVNWDPETDGIVYGTSNSYHNDRLAGMSLIYGDYFFTEAILKCSGKYTEVW